MKPIDQQTFAQAFREWIYADESGQNADRIARLVIAKAMSGHFAYFKLPIDLVEGKIRPTLEEELTYEIDSPFIVRFNDLGRNVERAA